MLEPLVAGKHFIQKLNVLLRAVVKPRSLNDLLGLFLVQVKVPLARPVLL